MLENKIVSAFRNPDARFGWNALIRRASESRPSKAVHLYCEMQNAGIQPDEYSLSMVLKACAAIPSLRNGLQIHSQVIKMGYHSDTFVANTLLCMYGSCKTMEYARQVFEKMIGRDLISWNSIISFYAKLGQPYVALNLFQRLRQEEEFLPNAVTVASAIRCCAHLSSPKSVEIFHGYVIQGGFESDLFVGNSLLDGYAMLGSVDIARKLFDGMILKDVVSWNTIITRYGQNGFHKEALELFDLMRGSNVKPDAVSAVIALDACSSLGDLEQGKLIHEYVHQIGVEENIFVQNSLVSMYAKCGDLCSARQVFDSMGRKTAVSWNAIIAGCVQCGFPHEAFVLFKQMRLCGFRCDAATFEALIQACEALELLQSSESLHCLIIQCGLDSDLYIGNSLLALYAKLCCIDSARAVFDSMSNRSLVSWNVIIDGYASLGHIDVAFMLFAEMQRLGYSPDSFTLLGLIDGCTSFEAWQQGMCVHGYTIRSGLDFGMFIGTAIVKMYAKHGKIRLANVAFDNMPVKDIVAWNALINSYSENGFLGGAMTIFKQMQKACLTLNAATILSLLNACSRVGSLEQGKWLHVWIIKYGIESDTYVETSLLDMYSKCGSLESACSILNRMNQRNIASWNAMLHAYVTHGRPHQAFKLLQYMQVVREAPDSVTAVNALQACIEVQALQEGMQIHGHIIRNYLEFDVLVGSAIVNMYCKCGNLDAATKVFLRMPSKNVITWNAIIAGYGMHGQGKKAVDTFENMQSKAVAPNDTTFLCLLTACNHAGLVEEGRKYFECMSRDFCITKAIEHYACIVDLLGRSGHLVEAIKLIETMPFEPNVMLWNTLLAACKIHNDLKLAKFVSQRISEVDPNSAFHALLANICLQTSKWIKKGKI